jgi:hypothetical protein
MTKLRDKKGVSRMSSKKFARLRVSYAGQARLRSKLRPWCSTPATARRFAETSVFDAGKVFTTSAQVHKS